MTPAFNSTNVAQTQSEDWIDSQEEDDFDKSIAKGGVSTPFPWKLHDMLDAMESAGDYSIVQWQPHGRAFVVHDPKKFVQVIMPDYFNQTKYASFQRQLNLYGFNRLSHGKDKGAYYHICFVRGQRNLCRNMVRQKIKGTKVRRSLSPDEEPNFYLPDWEKRLANAFNLQQPDMSATSLSSTPRSKAVKSKSSKLKKEIPQPPSDSLVSMMRETSKRTTPPLLPPPPVLKHMQQPQVSQSSLPDILAQSPPLSTPSRVQGGDLLFFEGQPFRYLDHIEDLPPISGQYDGACQESSSDLYSNSYKHKLHNMINSIVMDTSQLPDNQQGVCSV